jgi:DNA-binding response OmpR family regulator
MRLLLVEDDVMVASGIKLGLCDAGYAVDWVGSAERAIEAVQTEAFDAAIIDIGLPRMDGLALTATLRSAGRNMPVLILTARDALRDRVQGLDMGADDYMVKPFELPELLARLRALLRRSQAATTAVLGFGPIEMDTAHRQVRVGGQLLELGPREWTVLEYLLLQAPKPAAKDKLLQALTGWDKEITLNAIEVYISRLRSKLDASGVVLRAIRGFGYRLELAEGVDDAAHAAPVPPPVVAPAPASPLPGSAAPLAAPPAHDGP